MCIEKQSKPSTSSNHFLEGCDIISRHFFYLHAIHLYFRWWQLKYFLNFHPYLPGEMIQFD